MELLNRFPSFQQLQTNAVATLRRFPLTLLSAILGTVTAIILIEDPDDLNRQLFEKLLMVTHLGLPLFIALTILAEKRQWRRQVAFAGQAVGLILLVAYFFSLPEGAVDIGACMMRFALLSIGLHFLVACLPYFGGNQTHGFWQYNMSLFHRFLTAVVYSGVLYVGLTIALAAADHLFGIEVEPESYFQLWAIMAGVFNTWLFLAGVPKDLEALDQATDYPKGLAVFAQYILLPLVALYFVILIAYEAKIIITWNWPIGWVSELVLWFSVVGLLSLLLLYPLRKQAEKRWVQTFVNWFFRGLALLVPLLLLAILRRISDYGVTEPRYLVLAMAVGLVIVTLYFLISKARDIRIIPILLAAAALLSAYGPWSASAVSLGSQMGRLEAFMTANQMIEGGSLKPIESQPTFEDQKEMSSIIGYVCDWHGVEPFARWLDRETIDSLADSVSYALADDVAGAMGLEYIGRHTTSDPGVHFSIPGSETWSDKTSFVVTGFDYLVNFSLAGGNDFKQAFLLKTDSCFVQFDTAGLTLAVWIGPDLGNDSSCMEFDLAGTLDTLVKAFDRRACPIASRTFTRLSDDSEMTLVLEKFSGARVEEKLRPDLFAGHLLIRRE